MSFFISPVLQLYRFIVAGGMLSLRLNLRNLAELLSSAQGVWSTIIQEISVIKSQDALDVMGCIQQRNASSHLKRLQFASTAKAPTQLIIKVVQFIGICSSPTRNLGF